MNILPQNVQKLINSLERLPGLGPKSAARIAMFLLKSPDKFTMQLGKVIQELKENIVYCQKCFNIASSDPCDICASPKRDKSVICIVEDPLDVVAFEGSTAFEGVYHVLGGVISPVNGIGPEDITIDKLLKRIQEGDISEVIIATNPNIEGEATAMYIKEDISKLLTSPRLRQTGKIKNSKLKISRLARGLPTGADLEYADKMTLKKAFEGRTDF